jgi:hypothetical protein
MHPAAPSAPTLARPTARLQGATGKTVDGARLQDMTTSVGCQPLECPKTVAFSSLPATLILTGRLTEFVEFRVPHSHKRCGMDGSSVPCQMTDPFCTCINRISSIDSEFAIRPRLFCHIHIISHYSIRLILTPPLFAVMPQTRPRTARSSGQARYLRLSIQSV